MQIQQRLEEQRKVLDRAIKEVSEASMKNKIDLMKKWNKVYYTVRVPLTEVSGRDRDKSSDMTFKWGMFCQDVGREVREAEQTLDKPGAGV